jgi:organic hydroperoxide reductase OsmC/OhrA
MAIEAFDRSGRYLEVMTKHEYRSQLMWEGNLGSGTAAYDGYGRDFRLRISGKPDLAGSANKMFRGNPGRQDPEDLFLAAVASCHMLAYLALCAKNGITVVGYTDDPTGTLVLKPEGGGHFEVINLHPVVTISAGDAQKAMELHELAHERCFIANSCSVPIHHEARIEVLTPA